MENQHLYIMGQLIISTAMFNSYVNSNYQKVVIPDHVGTPFANEMAKLVNITPRTMVDYGLRKL